MMPLALSSTVLKLKTNTYSNTRIKALTNTLGAYMVTSSNV